MALVRATMTCLVNNFAKGYAGVGRPWQIWSSVLSMTVSSHLSGPWGQWAKGISGQWRT